MRPAKTIRTLVVDDSLLFRETLARGISQDPSIEVVATASNPFEARDRIIELQPDVMTLDVEMPRMNGIEFLRRLMPQYPLPVVMISALSESVFDALDAGAVDFVAKPNMRGEQMLESFINELVVKIKIASVARVKHHKMASPASVANYRAKDAARNRIIAIGASTGGTEAILDVIKNFTSDSPGTVVVQHMPAGFTKMYAQRLNGSCAMNVKEAVNGDKIATGQVLLAPGDYHMRVKKRGHDFHVECLPGEKVSGHCPSVDVLFNSIAECAAAQAIGVILTGMGADGAKGLLNMREKGSHTIGQSEASCVVYGMPRVAYEIGAVEKQVPLNRIASTIFSLLE